MRKKILLFFLLFFICIVATTTAQTDTYLEEPQIERSFDRDNWKRTIEGIDYSKDLQKKHEKEKEEEDLKEALDFSFFEKEFNSNVATVLLILIGLVLLFFILKATLSENIFVRNKKIQPLDKALSLEQIEENLEKNDPTNLIEQAIKAANYRLALRLYYLKVIRELSLANAIEWKQDKTNSDYLRELRLAPLQPPFRSITLAFERIWYGNRSLTEQEFKKIQPQFDHLINSIPKNEQ